MEYDFKIISTKINKFIKYHNMLLDNNNNNNKFFIILMHST